MSKIKEFNFEAGALLSEKYEVVEKLGGGWEGEVYLIREMDTGIERAAKFFYPQRNKHNQTIKRYAQKLHKLRNCNGLIRYISKERVLVEGEMVQYLLSDFVEGITLSKYMKMNHPKGLPSYKALQLFYDVVRAVEEIHYHKEFHGDIHTDNVILHKSGLRFNLKLIDIFHLRSREGGSIQDDIVLLCQLLHELIGGYKQYQRQPPIVKYICSGLRRSIIKTKFRNASQLRVFLEQADWEDIDGEFK